MDSQRQLATLEEDGLLIIVSSRSRLLTRTLLGFALLGFGIALSASMLVGLESPTQIFLRPALWAGAALLAAGVWLTWRTRLALAARAQLILTEDGFVIEHRDRGLWTTIHRVAWREVISFVGATGVVPLPGRTDHVEYALRPRAAERLQRPRPARPPGSESESGSGSDRQDAARPSHRPSLDGVAFGASASWAQRASRIEDGRGRIPGVIGADPQRLADLLRAAHRRFS